MNIYMNQGQEIRNLDDHIKILGTMFFKTVARPRQSFAHAKQGSYLLYAQCLGSQKPESSQILSFASL